MTPYKFAKNQQLPISAYSSEHPISESDAVLGSWCGQFHFSLLFHNLDLHLCIRAYPRPYCMKCKLRRPGYSIMMGTSTTIHCFLLSFDDFFSSSSPSFHFPHFPDHVSNHKKSIPSVTYVTITHIWKSTEVFRVLLKRRFLFLYRLQSSLKTLFSSFKNES